MVVIKVSVDKMIEQEFRKKAMSVFGHRRGALSDAATIAIKNWLKKPSKEPSIKTDDFLGIIQKVKMTSVQLQKRVTNERASSNR